MASVPPRNDTAEGRWQAFRASSKSDGNINAPADSAAWRNGRPWLDACPAVLVPVVRIGLIRAEAALREYASAVAPPA